jgi:D-cysteine desulfhydrase family pyridoxal phosphate-dependent enzyme
MTQTPRAALEARLAALPRVRLAHLPTPLEPCPRLSEALGGPEIWIKRDDLTGLAFGGNKTRQLEFVLADLLAQGCDVLVAGAYTQSNWCRQMTAACRRLGLDIALVLAHGEKGPRLQGNLLLDRLMGAEITVVDLDTLEGMQPLLEAKAGELTAAGRRPYLIGPMHEPSLVLGTIGYVAAALELDIQMEAQGFEPDHLYLAGANMTPAGLALGMKALGRPTRLRNIAPIRWSQPREHDIRHLANATAERLGLTARLSLADLDSTDAYIGPRYGVVTDAAREALRLLARTEGIILDPVYSAKAFAGLVDHVRRSEHGPGERVLFLHTGGTPALFAYAEDLGLDTP